MPGVGYLPTFFLLHHGAFTAFPKNDKCLGEEGGAGGWARLELNEPLLAKQKVKMAVYWPSSSFRFY